MNEKKGQLAQPQSLTRGRVGGGGGGGHEIACLLNWNEQTLFIATNDEINKDKLGN